MSGPDLLSGNAIHALYINVDRVHNMLPTLIVGRPIDSFTRV